MLKSRTAKHKGLEMLKIKIFVTGIQRSFAIVKEKSVLYGF